MKPLYIDGTEGRTSEVCLDGPALRVDAPCSATQRFPLARVSRVVVGGQVSWSTEALLACADAGIVICFLRGDGRPRARWIGQPTTRSTFTQHWRDFLDRPDWEPAYSYWRTNLRRHAIRFCAMRLGWRPDRKTVQATAVLGGSLQEAGLREAKRHLYGFAYSRSLEELSALGFGCGDPSLRIVAPDLAMAVQWGLHPDLVAWRRDHGWPAARRDAAAFFEHAQRTAEFHLRHALRGLSRFLEEQPDAR